MRCKQIQLSAPAAAPGPRSPVPRCKPTCSPPTNALPGSTPESSTSRNGCPQALGEQTWRESGLGAPADIDALHQRINQLEQHNLDLQQQLDERDEDLTAARATNRELMARLNTTTRTR